MLDNIYGYKDRPDKVPTNVMKVRTKPTRAQLEVALERALANQETGNTGPTMPPVGRPGMMPMPMGGMPPGGPPGMPGMPMPGPTGPPTMAPPGPAMESRMGAGPTPRPGLGKPPEPKMTFGNDFAKEMQGLLQQMMGGKRG